MLARALGSLRAQTHRNYHCMVFDDSPEGEGEAVVRDFPDLEIHHIPTRKNLGVFRNLERCFQTRLYRQADFCFCLEDDNDLFPELIESNIAALERSGLNILLRNQFIETVDGAVLRDRTTMPALLRPGVVAADLALLSIFTGGGFSNGGLFWRATAKSELKIDLYLTDAVLAEYLRPFTLREDVLFLDEPLGTWKDNRRTSFRIKHDLLGAKLDKYRRMATVAGLRRAAYRILKPRGDLISEAPEAALSRFELSMAGTPALFRPRRAPLGKVAVRWVLGAVLAVLGFSQVSRRQLERIGAQEAR
jgi:glycosyltransferase involved in cell wall biosynthesis